MSRTTRPPCAALAVALVLATAIAEAQDPAPVPDARRDGPEEQGLETFRVRLEALGGAGFGDVSLDTGETVNNYGASVGVRAGYVLPFGAYLGLHYHHFFGESSSYPVPLLALVEHHSAAHFVTGDLGYELALHPAVLRPLLGVGAGILRRRVSCEPAAGSFDDLAQQVCSAETSSDTEVALAVVPGLLLGVSVSRFYAFSEIRYYVRNDANAFGVFGGVGVAL